MKFMVYIENRMIAEVSGSDFAYEVYAKASELAEMIGEIAHLVDGETGEVIESSDEDYDYDEPADIDSDMGFDPYMGCFSEYVTVAFVARSCNSSICLSLLSIR